MPDVAFPRVLVHGDPAHAPLPGVILGVRRNRTPLDYLVEFEGGNTEFVPAEHCELVTDRG